MPRGTLAELHRYPVKSMGGERLDAVLITERGMAGDRVHAVWQRRGRRLSARVAPKLLRWSAGYEQNGDLDPRDPAMPVVHAPSGRTFAFNTRDDDLRGEINADLGRNVALVRDPDGLQDVQHTLLVTVEGSRRRLEEEVGHAVDVRRFRPNLHVDLGDAEPFAEADWAEGTVVRVGDLELEVAHPCDRCAIVIHDPENAGDPWPDLLRHINAEHGTFFGFRAVPRNAARIAVGDAVEVEPA